MARITVEDCILEVPNRFDLVLLAARRAKEIGEGALLTVKRDNDKNPVIALREIAEKTIQIDDLYASLINLHRQYAQAEPQEEELEDQLEQELASIQDMALAQQNALNSFDHIFTSVEAEPDNTEIALEDTDDDDALSKDEEAHPDGPNEDDAESLIVLDKDVNAGDISDDPALLEKEIEEAL